MNVASKLLDRQKRYEIVQSWPERLDRIKENTNLSRAKFCQKHGMNASQLSRHINGRMLAEWETIDRIERAIKAEEQLCG